MSTESGAALQSAPEHPPLVEPVARLHVPALSQSDAVVSLNSGRQTINKNQNWHMQGWFTVDKQSGALTGYCRTWCTDNTPFGAGLHGGIVVNLVDAQGHLAAYVPPHLRGRCLVDPRRCAGKGARGGHRVNSSGEGDSRCRTCCDSR